MMDDLASFEHLTILLADDDDSFREITAKTLKKLFQHVYLAHDGESALNLFRKMHPNIIMLDIRMGNINGLQVAKEIRKENSTVPICIVSSYSETSEILEACELNLVKYLVKPFSYDCLLHALTKCLFLCHKEMTILKKINDATYYNPYSKSLIQDSRDIPLTKNEITVLEYLLPKRGQVISYHTLISILGGTISNIAVQNLVFRLRKKIGHNSIQNLSKIGYIFL